MKTVTRTDGYRALMGEIRMGDFGDPWGTAMGWLFGIAEVVYVETGDILPEFSPSILMSPGDRSALDGYEQEDLLELLDGRYVTIDDMRSAYVVMSRYADWCKLAGKDY